jgi:hypothetical protein
MPPPVCPLDLTVRNESRCDRAPSASAGSFGVKRVWVVVAVIDPRWSVVDGHVLCRGRVTARNQGVIRCGDRGRLGH